MTKIVVQQHQLAHRRLGMSFTKTQQQSAKATMKCYLGPVEEAIDDAIVDIIVELDPRYLNHGGRTVTEHHDNEFIQLGSIDVEDDNEVGLETTPDCWALVPCSSAVLSMMPATSVELRKKIVTAVVAHTGWSILDGEGQEFTSPEDL